MPEHTTKPQDAGDVRPWLKSYPPGLSWDAPIATCPVQQILDDAVSGYPARAAIEFEGRTFSYAELGSLADRAAQGLRALGVAPGVHVGLYLPNTPHYALAFFAVLKAGGTVVNFSPLDAADVVRHKIADSRTDIVITLDLPALYPMMDGMLDSTRLQRLVVGSLSDMGMRGPAPAGPAIAFDDRRIRFEDLVAGDGALAVPAPADLDLDQAIAVLQYTGGTTGLPKGAVLSHAMLSAACSQALLNTRHDDGMRLGRETMLCVLPLFHIYALTFNLLLALRLGATTILHQRFEPERAIAEIAARRVTVFFGVPTMFTALNACPLLDAADLSSLRFCNSGGAPLPEESARRFREATGQVVLEGWGMTELCGVGTITPRGTVGPPGACGMPLAGVDIRFADVNDPGRTVPYGERGEICVAGPNVLRRYWQQPQASAEAMTADGYFRTGDVGHMDRDGYLHITDRIKDMLLCSGYNVYPRLIEEAIHRHPAVAEVIVIGVEDPYRGQQPKAYIRLRDGAAPFTLEELKLFLRDALGKHEMVQAIAFRDALPKTAVGKLSKKELYEEERKERQERQDGAPGAAPTPDNPS